MTPLRLADRWLFAAGSAHRLAAVRSALAGVIGLRIALGPFRGLHAAPAELFEPPPFLSWLEAMPAHWWFIGLQLLGVGGAIVAIAGRLPRVALLIAWLSLLTLAGLKGTYGKVLHNDVLLLLAAVPILAAPSDARRGDPTTSRRFGWPVQTSLAVIATVYAAAGVQKLVYSGFDWVTGDNMRWVLYQAAGSGRVRWPEVPLTLADCAWVTHVLAGGLLAGELLAPLLIVPRRTRSAFAAFAVGLHAGTWLLLGLDYWAWALTVTAVVIASSSDFSDRTVRRAPSGRLPSWRRAGVTLTCAQVTVVSRPEVAVTDSGARLRRRRG